MDRRRLGCGLTPTAWKRLIVARTVEAATPIRRAISRAGSRYATNELQPKHFAHLAPQRRRIQPPTHPRLAEGSLVPNPDRAPARLHTPNRVESSFLTADSEPALVVFVVHPMPLKSPATGSHLV